jgi:hypothetical protein
MGFEKTTETAMEYGYSAVRSTCTVQQTTG